MDILDFILKVQAISKIGMTFSNDPYALENYEELEQLSKQALEEILDLSLERKNYFARDIYPTPSVSVRGYVLNNQNEILLVKETDSQTWSIPGGWCDIGSTPKQAVVLEIFQESGLQVSASKLLGILNRNLYTGNLCTTSEYSISFLCEYITGEFKTNHETCDAKFFSIDNLPELSHKNTNQEIQKVWEVIVNDLPPIFD